jgi:magnesium chelatase family protein
VPPSRITVHLGPADIPKQGGRFDLPIALGVIMAEKQPAWPVANTEFLGELALNGELRPITGALPAVLAAAEAGHALVLPAANAAEAALVAQAEVYTAAHLSEVVAHLAGTARLPRLAPRRDAVAAGHSLDLSDVRGQAVAKRALIVAAAGGHNLILIGPPGSGKSMLAERMSGLLPPLEHRDMLRVASIASVAGDPRATALTLTPPFRAPHHTTSAQALVGGGTRPRPGEISLAHRGVLFLDEFAEFQSQALDSLRQPLETGEVSIARANHRITYPARFMLVAAMNPCRCGRASDPGYICKRGANIRCAADYQAKLSGPLLDRIDLHVEIPAVTAADLILPPPSEGSAEIAARVARTRDIQSRRYAALGLAATLTNAQVSGPVLEQAAKPDRTGLTLLRDAADAMRLSARGYHRVLRVARTLADLDGAEAVGRIHLAEALSYRALTDEMRRAA